MRIDANRAVRSAVRFKLRLLAQARETRQHSRARALCRDIRALWAMRHWHPTDIIAKAQEAL